MYRIIRNIVMPVLLCLVLSCSDEPVTPQHEPICNDLTLCDTCGTTLPRTDIDSALGLPPFPDYIVRIKCKRPDDEWYAGRCTRGGAFPVVNSFEFNIVTKEIRIIPGSLPVEWSADGKKLLMDVGWDIGVYDSESGEITIVAENSRESCFSNDNQWVYYTPGLQKVRIDGTDRQYLPFPRRDAFSSPRLIDDSTLLCIRKEPEKLAQLSKYNLRTGELSYCGFDVPGSDQTLGGWDELALSPNRKMALASVYHTGYWHSGQGGVYLFDLENVTARKVLPEQYWGNQYWPHWSSNSTFFATYFCRKDSAAMVYEFDLNGKTIRQVTFKEQKFYP